MGLDMYLYRVKKAADVESGKLYTREELTDISEDLSVLKMSLKDAVGHDETKELADFLTPINLEVTLYDKEKIEKDYHVSIEYPCHQSSSEWGFRCKDREDVLMISMDDLLGKYSYKEVLEHVVAEFEELRYWRKEYDLQDQFYSLFSGCGDLNTTYKRVSADDLMSIGIDVEEEEGAGFFYFEWY